MILVYGVGLGVNENIFYLRILILGIFLEFIESSRLGDFSFFCSIDIFLMLFFC